MALFNLLCVGTKVSCIIADRHTPTAHNRENSIDRVIIESYMHHHRRIDICSLLVPIVPTVGYSTLGACEKLLYVQLSERYMMLISIAFTWSASAYITYIIYEYIKNIAHNSKIEIYTYVHLSSYVCPMDIIRCNRFCVLFYRLFVCFLVG